MRHRRLIRPWAAPATLAVLLVGCGETGPNFRSVGVEILPATLVLDALGATGTLEAVVTDGSGDPVFGTQIRWESSDPQVAEVDGGVVTARGRGTASITATVSGLGVLQASASAQVRVEPAVTRLDVVDDGGGSAAAGTALAPLRIRGFDRLSGAVAGVTIRFRVLEGGGTVDPAEAVADSDGVATAIWTLGPLAGPLQRLQVETDDASAAVVVEALGVAGPPASIEVTSQWFSTLKFRRNFTWIARYDSERLAHNNNF